MTFLWQTCISRKRMWKKNIGGNVTKNVYKKYVLYKFCCVHYRSKIPRKPGFAAVAVHVVAVVDAFALERTLQSIFLLHLHFDLHAFCLTSWVHKRQLLVSTPGHLNTLHLYCRLFTLPTANTISFNKSSNDQNKCPHTTNFHGNRVTTQYQLPIQTACKSTLTFTRILLAKHRTDTTVRRETQQPISILCALRSNIASDLPRCILTFVLILVSEHGTTWSCDMWLLFSWPNGNNVAPLTFACILFSRYGTTWSCACGRCHQTFSWHNSIRVSELPLDVETIHPLNFRSGQFAWESGNT